MSHNENVECCVVCMQVYILCSQRVKQVRETRVQSNLAAIALTGGKN